MYKLAKKLLKAIKSPWGETGLFNFIIWFCTGNFCFILYNFYQRFKFQSQRYQWMSNPCCNTMNLFISLSSFSITMYLVRCDHLIQVKLTTFFPIVLTLFVDYNPCFNSVTQNNFSVNCLKRLCTQNP